MVLSWKAGVAGDLHGQVATDYGNGKREYLLRKASTIW